MAVPQWILDALMGFMAHRAFAAAVSAVFGIVFLALVLRWVADIIFRKLLKNFEAKHNLWDDTVTYALQKPVIFIIWLLGLTLAAQVFQKQATYQGIYQWIDPIRLIGILVFLTWFALRFVSRAEYHFLYPMGGRVSADKTSIMAVSRLIRVLIFSTAVLVTLQTMGMSISGLLAVGGVGGLAIGFAAKDISANFFGGLMIYMDRPFSVGDWIQIVSKGLEGTVEHIGWRTTRIRCFDRRPLYVPNSVFSTESVVNPSRMTNRQIKEMIGLRYKDAAILPKVLSEIEQMIITHPDIDTNQTTFVAFDSFGESSLRCQVYCFTKTTQWVPYLRIQQDVFCKILAIIEQYGAEVAFPTRTVEKDQGPVFFRSRY